MRENDLTRLEMIKTRRTIRKFTSQKVEREKLEKLQRPGSTHPTPEAKPRHEGRIIFVND